MRLLSIKTLVKFFIAIFCLYLFYLIVQFREETIRNSSLFAVPPERTGGIAYPVYPDDNPVFQRKAENAPKLPPALRIYPSFARPWDDRILAQMSFVPESVKKGNVQARKNKVLLYYNSNLQHPLNYISARGCAVQACELTADNRWLSEADVVVSTTAAFMGSRARQNPQQIWVMYILESPEQPYVRSAGAINWTASYRRDSTIVTPYEKYVPYNKSLLIRPEPLRNYAAGKTRMVAWFVSNCHASNRRMDYVKTLSKFVEVDIYGSCGPLSCPRYNRKRCSRLLNEHYKFYLSFENSNCRDYITEKFFVTGLQHDVIPIVMGAHPKDYMRVAPPHSYIHVENFVSPKHLAGYLHRLNNDDALYNAFFRWKGLWSTIDTLFPCRLCALAHDSERRGRSWYDDAGTWWDGPGVCIGSGKWKKQKLRMVPALARVVEEGRGGRGREEEEKEEWN